MNEPVKSVSIYKILDVSFSVHESLFRSNEIPTRYTIKKQTGFNVDDELFNIMLHCSFSYIDSKESLATIEVENIFHIPNLKDFLKEGTMQLALPGEILVSTVGLSLSHTRAIFSKNLRGTLYDTLILPIVNPIDITNNLFYNQTDDLETIENKKE